MINMNVLHYSKRSQPFHLPNGTDLTSVVWIKPFQTDITP